MGDTENAKLLLATLAQSLEMMKVTLDSQVTMIKQQLAAMEGLPVPDDPDILGYDSLGRIKRKRKISPEVRAQRVQMIMKAREARQVQVKAIKAAQETMVKHGKAT